VKFKEPKTGKYNEEEEEEKSSEEDVTGFITKALASSSAADVTSLGEHIRFYSTHTYYVLGTNAHPLLLNTIFSCIKSYASLYLVERQDDYKPRSMKKIGVVVYLRFYFFSLLLLHTLELAPIFGA
jgi:hypothetical protein